MGVEGRVVVITGASSGIGKAIAELLSSNGANGECNPSSGKRDDNQTHQVLMQSSWVLAARRS